MLKQLYIRNFTLIDTLNMQFKSGFSVITGETGAGKSIILGAIGLLLGQRADSKMIRHGAAKCVIEAHFDLSRYGMEPFFEKNDIEYDAYDCIIRRELTATGKSRAFINDSPAPLSMLKELGEMLVDVHSQHQNLLINKQDFQLNVVDIIADNSALLDRYQETYALYTQKRRLLDELREEIEGNRRNADFLQFQYDELVSAGLISGEQEELEQKADTMSHSEEIKSALYDADRQLSADGTGVVSNLHSAVNAINSIIRVMPAAETLAQRMESCHIELKDISLEISSMLDDIDFDPAELDAINSRLDKIYDLEKKYRCNTVDELTELRNSLEKKLNEIENSDGTLNELEREIAEIKAECERQAATISTTRRASAAQIEREMLTRLSTLGMPNVQFRVAIDNEPLGKNGTDKASFLFCANRSGQLQPVAQVASGGEIARVMLSLKAMISGAVKLPTIIFDEIDTGVSGKIAEQMAQIMQQMGRSDRQVISITHLPQIAALGTTHYKVYKEDTTDGTISHMQMLTPDERIREIAQMLSGSDVSEAAINNAKQLLKI
ncbi:DNA repair protein RecN [Xylanibacter rodentium]|jgi:DNA repair protein RecN (Recombination protein N)|uniref:DNA repair protein RecN n=1 Tax=Xylanibacter rodentium TaxID=2736289 RepID=A0ABX2ATU3_9BACT|nr:DNA repair protein RecN [Xylanibacter rodentium]NPE10993.1 DNA repair protein RecN [Prevotella sp. PJ1A]NPE14159.1 DNA repair protein RecN [Xylanibacter rodentium]NPE37465.1 DNA repair protein RecN [Prevotella sp. PCJ2]